MRLTLPGAAPGARGARDPRPGRVADFRRSLGARARVGVADAPDAERLVARVDTLAGAGEGGAARYLYQQVFREFPEDPAVPAPLRARPPRDRPARRFRNYRAAHRAFTRW
jgi:hypothetical protein